MTSVSLSPDFSQCPPCQSHPLHQTHCLSMPAPGQPFNDICKIQPGASVFAQSSLFLLLPSSPLPVLHCTHLLRPNQPPALCSVPLNISCKLRSLYRSLYLYPFFSLHSYFRVTLLFQSNLFQSNLPPTEP